MRILENYNLKPLNTFGVPAKALFFSEIRTEAEIQALFGNSLFIENKKLFLGGGSNVLFRGDFGGIVVLNKLKGIEILLEDVDSVLVKSMGGEVWHDLVEFAVGRGYWGIENLALIPGSVGAAPMQNIGAYGAELKNVLESVEAYDVATGEKSIFKNELKDKYFISAITLRLSKKEKRNISYKVLKEYLEKNKIEIKGPKDISDAVSEIRRSKLPDPKVVGNAGSFFKNVFLPEEKLKNMLKIYPDMPYFTEDDKIKVPAAWFIEKCGWKGKRFDNVGVHSKQALVLINYGGATGQEVEELAIEIVNSVFKEFKISLKFEVNLI